MEASGSYQQTIHEQDATNHHNGSSRRRSGRAGIAGLSGLFSAAFMLAVLSSALKVSATPLAGTISFEESLDTDGTQFDNWDIVTTQYLDNYGISFSKIGTNAAQPTIFDGVLPDYYPPHSGTRILSNWSNYGQAEPAGCLRISFDVSPSGFGSGLSTVNGWVTVASNSGDPQAFMKMEAFNSSGQSIDSATVLRNLGSSDFLEVHGDRDIAYVVFTHSEGPTDYHWALDNLGYAVLPQPATAVLIVLGCTAVGRRRAGNAFRPPIGEQRGVE